MNDKRCLLDQTPSDSVMTLELSDTISNVPQLTSTPYSAGKRRPCDRLRPNASASCQPNSENDVASVLQQMLLLRGSALGDFVVNSCDEREDVLRTVDSSGDSVVHWAARLGCCRQLRRVLTASNVNVCNNSETTPLHMAAEAGYREDVVLLLKAGALLTQDGDGWTPLHSAVASMAPDRHLVRLLVDAAKRQEEAFRQLLDAKTNITENTALHLAASNPHVNSPWIIEELRALNPAVYNAESETAFDVAARCPNHAVMKAMLTKFPLLYQDPHDSGRFERDLCKLLDVCARNANAPAVGLLIQRGADIDRCDLLRTLVDESVRDSSRAGDYLQVYNVVVKHSVEWLCRKKSIPLPKLDSEDFRRQMRNAMLYLLTKRPDVVDQYSDVDDQTSRINEQSRRVKNQEVSVIEHAIKVGAHQLVPAIFNTPNVFRFNTSDLEKRVQQHEVRKASRNARASKKEIEKSSQFNLVTYDVSDMLQKTMCEEYKVKGVESACTVKRFRPQRPYIESILAQKHLWNENGIIHTEPFRELTTPLLNCSRGCYFVLGLLQLVFMIAFSAVYTPDFSANQGTNATSKLNDILLADNSKPSATYPSPLWLLWPFILLLYNLVMYTISVRSHLRGLHRKLQLVSLARRCLSNLLRRCMTTRDNRFAEQDALQTRTGNRSAEKEEVPTLIMLTTVDRLPACAFSLAVLAWFHAYRCWFGDASYLYVTSIIFLFGWISTFQLFSGISKHIYIFTLILKQIIVKDILSSFMFVYAFVVIAFSFALYVLRLPELSETAASAQSGLEINIYEVFATGLTLGEFIHSTVGDVETVNGRWRLLRLVFAVYLCMTALVLVNVLIAMMTNRYERAKQSAERAFRLNGVAFALRVHGVTKSFARRFGQTKVSSSEDSSPPESKAIEQTGHCFRLPELLPDSWLLNVHPSSPWQRSKYQRLEERIERMSNRLAEVSDALQLLQNALQCGPKTSDSSLPYELHTTANDAFH